MQTKNQTLTGIICCLYATLSWGAMFPIMSHALLKMDSFYFTTIRCTLISLVLISALYLKEGKNSFALEGHGFSLATIGSIGFAGFGFLVFLGQRISGPSGALSASTIMATMPLQGLLITWLIQGKKPSLFSFVCILLSLFGVLLVIHKGDLMHIGEHHSNTLATILLLLGASCWVIYTVSTGYFTHWSALKYSTLTTILSLPVMYVISALLTLTHIIRIPTMSAIVSIAPEFFYVVIFAGVFSLVSWTRGNAILTPVNGVLFMNVVPISAFLISALDGVPCSQGQLIGVCIVAGALMLNNLYQRRIPYSYSAA